MGKRGQLFIIEVIIAVSIMLVLITAMFTTQQLTPAPTQTNLVERGQTAINILVDNGLMAEYLSMASYNYYTLGNSIFSATNSTKAELLHTISASLPITANFRGYVYEYNSSTAQWVRIDIANFRASLPSGTSQLEVEYYTPGIYGQYGQYRFQLQLWQEIGS